RIPEHMLAARLLKLGNTDRVVALKFPAYYIEHDAKVVWLLHQFRQVYDLWGTRYQGMSSSPETEGIRDMVRAWDNEHLSRARRIFTNSSVTSERLKRFNGLDSEVLLPPLWDEAAYHTEGY